MVLLAQYHDRPAIPYGDDEQSVIRDAVLFCARGLGIAESRIEVSHVDRIAHRVFRKTHGAPHMLGSEDEKALWAGMLSGARPLWR